ncbi:MAG: outer membrane protein assembly factor BamA [Candidatus Pelagibacter sp.]|nr:outer membrane protein assembly factor BamA [Candidatus Pelagibacter sp.]OUV87298.1 MAG: outer membrane protein assembly factor BamA [Pelagibacteraceae bacterium TMED136]|tara:strand:+ start:38986 stop:41220 length:2235 start_codon:yes stop_codon:yes gene_type:complete
MKILFKLIILFSFLLPDASSNEEIKYNIEGNKRISNETILNIIDFRKNKKYNVDDLNEFQKKLFNTNYFSNVSIKIIKNKINIIVKENPIIDFFYINGVINNKREDFLYENLSLGQNKIFSDALLKKDIEKIKEIYQDGGYFDVTVKTEISKISGNALNVVINIDRKEKYQIKRIYFIGNKKFKSSVLTDVISSSEDGWWKFLGTSSLVNKNQINFDKKLLKSFYLNNGYYDVQITSSDVNFIGNNKADLTFSINSGNKYYFSKYEILDEENNLNKKNKEDINKLIKKKIKGKFSKKKLDDVNNILNEYLRNKKIEFVTFFNKIKKSNEDKLDVEFRFVKKPRKFVNIINISGNTITEESVIRRNLLLSEGDSYLDYKIVKSIDKVKSLRIFKDVKFKTVDSDTEKVDLNISVEEQPTGSISAGIGVGSAGSTISSSIVEKNLFGKGIVVDSNVSFGTEKISGNVGFSIPDFMNTDNIFNYNIFATSTDYTNSGYESKKLGNVFSTKFNVYEDVSLKTGFAVDLDSIETNPSASTLYQSREGDYLTYKGFYSITNDKRNSGFQPTKGYRLGFGQGLALPGSDITYLENSISGAVYHSISNDYVISLKSGLNSINSLDDNDVKLSDRKFLRQSNLRGFENYGVGPKDGTDHIGGNYSAYASLSTTIPNPIPDSWNAKSILFFDTGNVWGVDFDDSIDSNKLRSSAGISLEWVSPLGPLSVTLSENISKADGDLEENFSFQIGSNF